MALFCVGEEGGLVEDTAVVMEEWGRLGVGAGGALACRRPLAEALRLREDGAHGETTRDEGSGNRSRNALFWTVRSRSNGGEYEVTWPNEEQESMELIMRSKSPWS